MIRIIAAIAPLKDSASLPDEHDELCASRNCDEEDFKTPEAWRFLPTNYLSIAFLSFTKSNRQF